VRRTCWPSVRVPLVRPTREQITRTLRAHVDGDVGEPISGSYSLIYVVDEGPGVYPRRAAYKTLNPAAFGDGGYREAMIRFEHEARNWFDFAYHPNILPPLAVKKLGGLAFILMPFCENDLREVIRGADHFGLGILEALWIAAQIASGISFAQTQGLVAHQDLKPENVLIWSVTGKQTASPLLSSRVCVADFGLANAFIALGIRKGTWEYMAPEQFTSDADMTPAVDSYALGLILWEMITGMHPAAQTVRKAWKKWARNGWQRWHEQPGLPPFSVPLIITVPPAPTA